MDVCMHISPSIQLFDPAKKTGLLDKHKIKAQFRWRGPICYTRQTFIFDIY